MATIYRDGVDVTENTEDTGLVSSGTVTMTVVSAGSDIITDSTIVNPPQIINMDGSNDYIDEEGYQKVINGNNYAWYEEFSEWCSKTADNKYATMDDYKNITIDETQVNISQESYSQFIPFKIPRYYDGMDLSKTIIQIHYVNVNGGESFDTVVNVTCNDDYLKFGWLVSPNATVVSGLLRFEIVATGITSKNDVYIWKSKINNQITVIASLSGEGEGSIDNTDWYQSFVNSIEGDLSASATNATNAQNSATAALLSATNAQNSAAEIKTQYNDVVNGIEILNNKAETTNEDISSINNEIDYIKSCLFCDEVNAINENGYTTVDVMVKNDKITSCIGNGTISYINFTDINETNDEIDYIKQCLFCDEFYAINEKGSTVINSMVRNNKMVGCFGKGVINYIDLTKMA